MRSGQEEEGMGARRGGPHGECAQGAGATSILRWLSNLCRQAQGELQRPCPCQRRMGTNAMLLSSHPRQCRPTSTSHSSTIPRSTGSSVQHRPPACTQARMQPPAHLCQRQPAGPGQLDRLRQHGRPVQQRPDHLHPPPSVAGQAQRALMRVGLGSGCSSSGGAACNTCPRSSAAAAGAACGAGPRMCLPLAAAARRLLQRGGWRRDSLLLPLLLLLRGRSG